MLMTPASNSDTFIGYKKALGPPICQARHWACFHMLFYNNEKWVSWFPIQISTLRLQQVRGLSYRRKLLLSCIQSYMYLFRQRLIHGWRLYLILPWIPRAYHSTPQVLKTCALWWNWACLSSSSFLSNCLQAEMRRNGFHLQQLKRWLCFVTT